MAQSAPRAVVIQHEEEVGLGHFGPALQSAGFQLVKRFRGVEHADLDAPLVVVLGGRMGVGDVEQHAFLDDERAFLAERLALDRPVLGLCLGAQLLAWAAGATVSRGKNGAELGAAPLRWTADAHKSPLFAPLGAKTIAAHWHQDTFSAVPGATLLASTDRYTQQAFQLGRSFGFQFHLEVNAEQLGRWLDSWTDSLTAFNASATALKATLGKLKAVDGAWADCAHRLARHFLSMS